MKGEACLNLSAVRLIGGNQSILRGVKVVKVTALKDTIRHIGGISALFPLLSELAAGPSPKQDETEFLLASVANGSMIAQLLHLIADLLLNSPGNQEDMMECNGFQVVGHILQKLPSQYFTKETTRALDNLATSVLSNGKHRSPDRTVPNRFCEANAKFRSEFYFGFTKTIRDGSIFMLTFDRTFGKGTFLERSLQFQHLGFHVRLRSTGPFTTAQKSHRSEAAALSNVCRRPILLGYLQKLFMVPA